MVKKAERQRMQDHVCDRIDEAGSYRIIQADLDHVLLSQRPDLVERPAVMDLRLLSRRQTVKDWRAQVRQNRQRGIYTGNILYKDGKTFHVRLAGRGNAKRDQSLKRYNQSQLNRMLHLRGLEKAVLQLQSNFPHSNVGTLEMTYFQPESARLSESLRKYRMSTVHLDYSHLTRHDAGYGFAREGNSQEWVIADEIEQITGALVFHAPANGRLFVVPAQRARTASVPNATQTTLFNEAPLGHCADNYD